MGNWLEDKIRRLSQDESERVAKERKGSLELEKQQREEELRLQLERSEKRVRLEALRQKLNGVFEKYNAYSLLRDVKSALGGGKIVEGSHVFRSKNEFIGSAALALVFWRDTQRLIEGQNIAGEKTSGSFKEFSVDGIILYTNSYRLNNLYLHTGILYSRWADVDDRGMFSDQSIRDYLIHNRHQFPRPEVSIVGGTDYESTLRLKDELAKDVFQRQRDGRVPQRSIKNGIVSLLRLR